MLWNINIIKLLYLETGLLWPYYGNKKALSTNSLTKVIREIGYKNIPEYILLRAANRGKFFHKSIQDFFKEDIYPNFYNLDNSKNLETKIYDSIFFLKKYLGEFYFNQKNKFVGSEKLRYSFYKGVLLATYIDLEFEDLVIELKTNNKKMKDNVATILTFEIQLLIQYLCTGKRIFLFWISDDGIFFNEFKIKKELLDILDMLISLNFNFEDLSIFERKKRIDDIISLYSFSCIMDMNISFKKYLK